MFFKFNGDSNLFQDQIIGKNIFEIGSTYFRIGKSVDTSTPDPDFQEEFPKSGGKFVIVEVEDICVDRIRELELMAVFSSCYTLLVGPQLPNVQAADSRHLLEENDRKILKQKPNSTLQQAMEHIVWKTEEAENFFISTSQGECSEIPYLLTSKEYA